MEAVKEGALDSTAERVQEIAKKYGKNVYAPNFFAMLDDDADGKVDIVEFAENITVPAKDIHELDATPDRRRVCP